MESESLKASGANGHIANLEAAVLQRYGNAAQEVEACLCLPVNYDKTLLKVIPDEIIEKDYGCGDPSRYIRLGETVLDLGSGSGKACYIISQIVGAQGKVIGVDFNPPMLELARKYQKSIGDKLGYHNVEFRRGKIQDLANQSRIGRSAICKRIRCARSPIWPSWKTSKPRCAGSSR